MNNIINPEIITWARDNAGFSIEALSKKIKVKSDRLIKWEEGSEEPSYTQLEKIAHVCSKPIAVFLFPKPPSIEDISTQFRRLPDSELSNFSHDTYSKINLALSYKNSLYLLAEDMRLENKLFNEIDANNMDPKKLASMVRDYLGTSIEEQISIRSTEKAFKHWRHLIELSGIFTFKDSFKDKFISGFSLLDKEYPIIFINNSTEFSRQIFTLIHELGHILYGVNGITSVDESYINEMKTHDKKLEVYCNEFAGNFLVPNSEFQKDLKYIEPKNDQTIKDLALKYSVSREVILRRLLEYRVIDNNYYESKIKEWYSANYEKIHKSSGGNYYLTRIAYLGEGFTNIAFENLKRDKITERELAEHLNIQAKNLKKLHDKLTR